ncbi:hypothetical protein FRC01_007399 [Tulasnella sp. 417]|nr:hypothetical protein FRC01_007399 [Tulasnella sp. 417]
MVLSASLPRNAWNFRRVCRRWNDYVLGTLAPKRWLQGTSIYVRGPQSWIFFHAAGERIGDDDPPSNTMRRSPSSSGSSSGVGCGAGFSPPLLTAGTDSSFSHSTRFDFTRLVGAEVAHFEPVGAPLHPTHLRELIMKLEDEVQVIFQLSTPAVEPFKDAVVNSLSLTERTRPTLTLRWRELFTRTIASRTFQGDWGSLQTRGPLGTDSPSVLWVADGEDGSPGRWFSAQNDDPMSPKAMRRASKLVKEGARMRQKCQGGGRAVIWDLEDEDCAGSDGYDGDVENAGPPSDSELFDRSMSDFG